MANCASVAVAAGAGVTVTAVVDADLLAVPDAWVAGVVDVSAVDDLDTVPAEAVAIDADVSAVAVSVIGRGVASVDGVTVTLAAPNFTAVPDAAGAGLTVMSAVA